MLLRPWAVSLRGSWKPEHWGFIRCLRLHWGPYSSPVTGRGGGAGNSWLACSEPPDHCCHLLILLKLDISSWRIWSGHRPSDAKLSTAAWANMWNRARIELGPPEVAGPSRLSHFGPLEARVLRCCFEQHTCSFVLGLPCDAHATGISSRMNEKHLKPHCFMMFFLFFVPHLVPAVDKC